uniref:Uncharacterized protein n=1 Tax=Rangifer tarandus platyrhynchus TaxID=3082113 RepID=A0ACB0E7H3_RANTA|nr:unnamed protein product [Rangifer tarandus platyrhynchus]
MPTGPRTAETVVWHSLSITFSSSSLPTQIHVIQELVTFWCEGESQEPARKSRRVGDFVPRPLPAAPRRVRSSDEGLAARLPRCGGDQGGPGSPAARARVFGQRQPPGREQLRPALQHGGGGSGGRAAVSPALAAVTGAAAPPRLRLRRDPRRGRHAALRASEPGVFRTDYPGLLEKRARRAPANPRAGEARGRCRSAGAAGPGLRSEFRGARAARKDPSLRAGGKLVQERDCAATPPTPPKNRPRGHRGAGYQRTPLRSGRRSTKAISASPVAFSSPK